MLAVVIVSCGDSKKDNKQKPEEVYVDPRIDESMPRTSADTATVLGLAKNYLDCLKKNDVEGALSQLSVVKGADVSPLSEDRKQELRKTNKLFPILRYRIDEIRMYSDSDTEVRYTAEFFEKKITDKRPNTIQGSVHPRRVQGQWVLTLEKEKVETNFQKD